MKKIRLAFSPCPNDTFIFYAMVHGKVDTEGISFSWDTADVEELNRRAMNGDAEMIKVSYHAYLYLIDKYTLLNSGSALGFSNGPLLISKNILSKDDLTGKTIAIPGEYTTAHLLLKFFIGKDFETKIMIFNEIEDALLTGKADAGVIIHENRFTYEKKGLRKIADLGQNWQDSTGAPIPLGGIIAAKSLGDDTVASLNRIMRRSVDYAFANPDEAMTFVRCHAQEMDEEVMMKHIKLYVNEFTADLGVEGRKAIEILRKYEAQLKG